MRLLAPGKLFLIGEYGVLEGGAAVVAAVDRHAEIEVTPAPVATWADTDGDVVVAQPAARGALLGSRRALVQAVISTLSEASVPLAPVCVRADSTALRDDEKLGLGSSGAVCVGLVRAWAPSLAPEDALALALAAHRRFQGGRGSGGDVIASAMGGVCVVETDRLVRRVPGLVGGFAVVYTGISANTRVRLDQFRAWRIADPASTSVLRDLHDTTDSAIEALDQGDASAWCTAVRQFAALERRMTTGGVDVFTDPVEACVSLLESEGWAAKPSGAGGGDVVVAFHPTADPASLAPALAETAFSPIPLALEPSGVLVSPA